MNETEFGGTERFEVLRRLGAGGMGVVYEALDRERNVRLALKTLRSLGGHDLLQFKREFRALQDVQHPNLISLGELYEHRGQWFFTMELVRGSEIVAYVRAPSRANADNPTALLGPPAATATLSPFAGLVPPTTSGHARTFTDDVASTPSSRRPPSSPRTPPPMLDEPRLRAALAQLSQALVALHAAGKVHRDIKPSNILVTDEGRVVLLDFGLVVDVGGGPVSTNDRRLAGTIHYMAPESIMNAIGPEADWYAVGVLLYLVLTAELPFDGRPTDILLRKQREVPRAPREIVPDVPEELERLCLELLDPNPAKRPHGADVLRRLEATRALTSLLPPASRDAVFVGRTMELAALERAFEDARVGSGTVTAIVHGDSGIGKTALVRRFVEDVSRRALVLSGRCYEREAVPYKGVDGVIDALCQKLARLPEDELAVIVPENGALLAQMFPVLRRVPMLVEARGEGLAALEPHVARARTFAALRELLARLAARQPLVVTIDDLQWADVDSLALLSDLLRPPNGLAMLLVATTRDEGAPVDLPGDVRRVAVGPLLHGDAIELATTLVERAAGRADPALVVEEAKGHPLFIGELARYLRRNVHDAHVRLDDVLQARIAALPDDARRLLEIVSVAGAPVAEQVAARAALADPSEFHRCLALLRGANLVRTTDIRGRESAARAGAVETNHDRIREAVTKGLDEEARRDCARRLARSLEAGGAADPEALASWFRVAGEPARAARYAATAATKAALALAFDRAASLYRQAIDLSTRSLSDAETRALRIGLADALANAGRGEEAARAYLAASAIPRGAAPAAAPAAEAPEAPEAPEAHVLRRRAAEEYLRSGHIDEGLDVLAGVLDDVGMKLPRTPAAALASALYTRAKLRVRGERYVLSTAESRGEQGSLLLRRADAAWSVAVGLALVDIVRAADFQARAMLYALDAGDHRRLARSFAMASCFASSERSTRARALPLLANAEALARLSDDPYTQAWLPLARAMHAFPRGRFREALSESSAALAIFRDACTGAAWEATSARSIAFWSLGYLGEMRELARRVDELLREAVERGDRYAAINVRTGAAHLTRLAADDPDASREESARAIAEWSHRGLYLQHVFDLFTQAETLLYEEQPELGLARVAARWRDLERSLLLRSQVVRIFLFDLRARLELACALRARATKRRLLLRAVVARADDLDDHGLGWATAMAHALRAGVAQARGDRDRARGWLERASAGFRAEDMALHAAVAERASGALVGGARGSDLRRGAEMWMCGQGIANIDRWSRMLLPAFE